jgi:predicted pyridoxine 5'-phosphate oxidase superfamily flavin-nucleotide-binding protein
MAIFKFEDVLKEKGVKKEDVKSLGVIEKPQTQGRITETIGDIKGIGSDIVSAAKQRSANVGEAMEAQAKGEQGGVRTFLQGAGQAAGLGSDVIGSLFKGAVKTILSQDQEDELKTKVGEFGKAVVSNDVVQNIIQKYQALDPKTQRDIESAIGMGSLVADVTGLGVAGKGIKTGVQTGKELVEAGVKKSVQLSDDALLKAKQIFSNSSAKIADQVLPIPETVKTTLKRTSDDIFKKYVNQAKLAVTDQKAMTPLEIAGDKAVEALESVQKRLSSIGSQKSSIVAQSKVGLKPMGNVAVKARQNILKEIGDKTLDSADQNLVNDVLTKLTNLGVNPKLKQVDEFIDYAQEILYKGSKNLTLPIGDRTESILKSAIRNLNNQVKNIAPDSYRTLNAKYAEIIDTRNILNKALGAESSKGGSLMKRVFSPTDAGTKKLFADVKKLTGIDLTDEAVLAKFAMDLFGDARQASLLQQLNIPTQRGIIEKIIQTTGKTVGLDDWLRNLTIKRASKLK